MTEEFDYCADGCGRIAVAERTVAVYLDDDPFDPLVETIELVCSECVTKESTN